MHGLRPSCSGETPGRQRATVPGLRIFERILQVASGERTKSEQYDGQVEARSGPPRLPGFYVGKM